MKIVLINIVKGSYLEKIQAFMLLVNKRLILSKIQTIEFVSYSLNLFIKNDLLKMHIDNFNLNNNKNFSFFKNFENFVIAEALVEEIYLEMKLNKNEFISFHSLEKYFSSKLIFC